MLLYASGLVFFDSVASVKMEDCKPAYCVCTCKAQNVFNATNQKPGFKQESSVVTISIQNGAYHTYTPTQCICTHTHT